MLRRGPKVQAEFAVVLNSSPFLQCGSELRDQNSGDADCREVSRRSRLGEFLRSRLGPVVSRNQPGANDAAQEITQQEPESRPPIMNPDAAGIDIGATEIYVAVPADRDAESIRMFATFTEDLNRIFHRRIFDCGGGK